MGNWKRENRKRREKRTGVGDEEETRKEEETRRGKMSKGVGDEEKMGNERIANDARTRWKERKREEKETT